MWHLTLTLLLFHLIPLSFGSQPKMFAIPLAPGTLPEEETNMKVPNVINPYQNNPPPENYKFFYSKKDHGPIPPSGKEDNAPPKRFTSTELDVLPEFDPLKSTLTELLHPHSNVNENRNHGNHDLLQLDPFSGPPGAFPPPSTRSINSRIPSSTTVSTASFNSVSFNPLQFQKQLHSPHSHKSVHKSTALHSTNQQQLIEQLTGNVIRNELHRVMNEPTSQEIFEKIFHETGGVEGNTKRIDEDFDDGRDIRAPHMANRTAKMGSESGFMPLIHAPNYLTTTRIPTELHNHHNLIEFPAQPNTRILTFTTTTSTPVWPKGKWWSTTIPTDSSHSSHKHEEEEPPTLSPFSSTESQSIVLFNTLTPTSTNSLNSKSTVSQHRTMIPFTDSRQIDKLHKIGRKNDDDKLDPKKKELLKLDEKFRLTRNLEKKDDSMPEIVEPKLLKELNDPKEGGKKCCSCCKQLENRKSHVHSVDVGSEKLSDTLVLPNSTLELGSDVKKTTPILPSTATISLLSFIQFRWLWLFIVKLLLSNVLPTTMLSSSPSLLPGSTNLLPTSAMLHNYTPYDSNLYETMSFLPLQKAIQKSQTTSKLHAMFGG
ncbi:hypothetical protein WR25_15983 [Diploscapter pachys]|uniref:Uncharacterized protein n=1 Tax=Diploscapter pachys TaxID=2018661 RepID=A0A2A2M0N4_9BILA|nr:hypothetical protein WR25_15983 [Diploscapter pachys]